MVSVVLSAIEVIRKSLELSTQDYFKYKNNTSFENLNSKSVVISTSAKHLFFIPPDISEMQYCFIYSDISVILAEDKNNAGATDVTMHMILREQKAMMFKRKEAKIIDTQLVLALQFQESKRVLNKSIIEEAHRFNYVSYHVSWLCTIDLDN